MALRLTTIHRWCVTGTPIQRGLEDLYGLIKFVGISPVDNSLIWKHAIENPDRLLIGL